MIKEAATDRKLLYVQKKLLSKNELYRISGLEKVNPDRLKGLMQIINRNHVKVTRNVKLDYVQCKSDRRRSAGDLFLIMRYYYPDITFKELRELLITLMNSGKLNCTYCLNIHKRVFWKEHCREEYKIWPEGLTQSLDYKDELGTKFEEK